MDIYISNKLFTAKISSKGAELQSLFGNNKEYIWNGNPQFWSKHSPVLFPIIGTLKNNQYQYNDKKYTLTRHGFARDLEFKCVENKSNYLKYLLQSDEATMANYPFVFDLIIEYHLLENSIQISYTVINNNNFKMPFSIGAHPAFALGNDFENYSLKFSENKTLECYLLKHNLITNDTLKFKLENKQLKLNYQLFEKDALVFKKLKSKKITILNNNQRLLSIEFNDFNDLGIWTIPKSGFICLEPWLGYADTALANGDIFRKEGIQILEANQVFKASFLITIH